MFTGIVQTIGKIKSIEHSSGGARLLLQIPRSIPQIRLGSSVCVSGVCLTVAKQKGQQLWFDIMEQTMQKTTLAHCKVGDMVNVEPSLRVGDEVGGHFVFGHIDAIVKANSSEPIANSYHLTFELPKTIQKYIVPQGSVAIDGVSLTVAKVEKGNFMVSLVDYTLKHTTLKYLKKGDRVNVECDMLAKYVQRGMKT